jgi:hypothetical protein
VATEFKTPEALLIVEDFESSFIKNCLEYNIYRPTIYEVADNFNDTLGDTNIRDLIIFYSMNKTIIGKTPNELYEYYRTHLRGKDFTELLKPITPIASVVSVASVAPVASIAPVASVAPVASGS